MAIINNTSLSYDQIKQDLMNYIRKKPDNARWLDFLESSTGQTIIELMAGLGAYESYQNLMVVRESFLDTAQQLSNIIEAAFDRGLFLNPSQSYTLQLHLQADDIFIEKGEEIGSLADYSVYAMESKQIVGTGFIKVVVGRKQVFSQTLSGLQPYKTYRFLTTYKYPAFEIEELRLDEDLIINLQSDLNYLKFEYNDFVLRRVLPGEVRIYTGNGILGYTNDFSTRLTYTVTSYGDDIKTKYNEDINLNIEATILNREVVTYPSFSMQKEEIRVTGIYYPLDGRIVQDQDYESAIIKYFGGVILDCVSYNTDPDQQVYILFNDSANIEYYLEQIGILVNKKKAMGIQVFLHPLSLSNGITFDCGFYVESKYYSEKLYQDVLKFFIDYKILYKIQREDYILTEYDLAIELTNRFDIPFYCKNVNNQITIPQNNFLNKINMTLDSRVRV
jgi:hypothetical protein